MDSKPPENPMPQVFLAANWQEMDSNGIKLFCPKAVQSVSKGLYVLLSIDYYKYNKI